jgi:AhpD family alkylhydroperoxidase
MELEPRILALIAVGASMSANCQPCLQRNVQTALRCGADAQQIERAIDVGQRVRRGSASKLDEFVRRMNLAGHGSTLAAAPDCNCAK